MKGTEEMIKGLENLKGIIEPMNAVNEMALKAIAGATDEMTDEEGKKVMADITSTTQKILSATKRGDIKEITRLQTEINARYKQYQKTEKTEK